MGGCGQGGHYQIHGVGRLCRGHSGPTSYLLSEFFFLIHFCFTAFSVMRQPVIFLERSSFKNYVYRTEFACLKIPCSSFALWSICSIILRLFCLLFYSHQIFDSSHRVFSVLNILSFNLLLLIGMVVVCDKVVDRAKAYVNKVFIRGQ